MLWLCRNQPTFAQDWSTVFKNDSETFRRIIWCNDSVAMAIGKQGTVARTTDAGLSWTTKDQLDPGLNIELADGWFISPDTAFVTGNTRIFKTTDGGESYQNKLHPNVNYERKIGLRLTIDFASPSIGICGGNYETMNFRFYPSFFRTTNAGETWEICEGVPEKLIARVQMFDSARAIAIGIDQGRIPPVSTFYRTSDFGKTWVGGKDIEGIISNFHFVDSLVGWSCGHGSVVRRSIDGGASWQDFETGISPWYYGLWAYDSLSVVLCGVNGDIVRTHDGGKTWKLESSFLSRIFRSIQFNSKGIGLAVGEEGVIARFDPNISNVPNEQQSTTSAVKQFAVGLQTPDISMLRFEITQPMELSLTLYNSHGEIVQSQPARPYEQGIHSVRLETVGLPSGAYFCFGRWGAEQYVKPSNCMFIVND